MTDEKNLRYVATLPNQPLDINNVGLDQNDLFGDTVFPGKIMKHSEVFDNMFIGDLSKAFKGLAQGVIFGVLTVLAFIHLPKAVPFIFVPMALAFITGVGIATFRIWVYVYNVLDRPTAALKQAGGEGWFALARQSKVFQKDMESRHPIKDKLT